jgi:hypothetical protein
MKAHVESVLAALILLCGCLNPAALLAQYGTGVVLGTITDTTGAVAPGVTITVKDNATNETRTFQSDPAGNFRFPALPSGTYTLTATSQGFRTATVPDVVLRVNTQVRVDIVMQLGQVTETVEVSATTPQLQTDTAALGSVIDNRTMLELPLNARNFFDLVALTPGALKTAGGSSVMDERSVEIGGIRNTSTNAMLDGVDFSVGNINNPAIVLSLDAIDEFKVQVNFMDASYGHGAAGIDMATKRGANAFHGVVYDFVRNRAFQSGQYFRPATGAPRFSYNQFGASAGGPIRKDKTFYFGNYEGRRRRQGIILQGLVPTAEMQKGDFAGVGTAVRDPFNNNQPFPNNRIPETRWDPVTKQLIQYFPMPNFVNVRPGVNYLVTPSDIERRDQFTARVDHAISQKGTLFGRYSFADDDLGHAAYRIGKGDIRPDRTQNLSVGYTHMVSSTFVSETRLGFTKAWLARISDGDRFSTNYVAELGIKNLRPNPGEYALPSISLTGYNPGASAAQGGFGGYNTTAVQNNIYYRIAEAITYIRGQHTLKFGGDVSRLMIGYDQGSNQSGGFSFSNNFTGNSFANFLLGLAQSASAGLGSIIPELGGVAKYSIGTQVQWYVQDDFKVTNRLTLNLGLRYEYFQQWRGRLADFDLGTGRQLLAGSADYYVPGLGFFRGTGAPLLPERPIRDDRNNFAPRVGIAYRLGSKTTVRSGAGIFYALESGHNTLNSATNAPPFYMSANLTSSATTPELFVFQLFPRADETTTGVTVNNDLNKRTGYLYNYNFNIQHQIRPGLLVETGYVGNTGHKQYGSILLNQPRLPRNPASPEPFTQRMPYPDLAVGFSQRANYQWTNYNAGFVRVEQRPASGLLFSAAYTFSKLMDNGAAGQNMYDRRPERGLASNDVPHNFIFNYVWELPVGRGKWFGIQNRVVDAVIGGWQLSGITNFRSGMPMTIGTSGDLARVGTGSQRADATGVRPRRLDPRTNELRGFDTTAYGVPAIGTFGNLARNTQPGFGLNNWDVGINKNFEIRYLGEASRLQVRAEWFNFFNHTQFRGIGTTVNVPSSFGIVNSAHDPRILQVAAKLYW